MFFSSTQTDNENTDALQNILRRLQNDSSLIKIKLVVNNQTKFSCQPVSVLTVKEVIETLVSNKATAGEIPIKIFKESGFTVEYLTSCLNESISSGKFPDSLKLSNILPVHKKKDSTNKCNYGPVSVLPLLCKVHSTQHALFKFLQACRKELDNSGFIGTIFMDLSKAYDCLPHDLLITKLGHMA